MKPRRHLEDDGVEKEDRKRSRTMYTFLQHDLSQSAKKYANRPKLLLGTQDQLHQRSRIMRVGANMLENIRNSAAVERMGGAWELKVS